METMTGLGNKKKESLAPIWASSKTKAKAKTRKPSPDSVMCIDLTSSNDDSAISPGQDRRLGTVRKELEPSSATKGKKGGLKTVGLEDTNHDEIIIIDSDDDDDDEASIASNDSDCVNMDVDNAGAAVASRPTKKARLDSPVSDGKTKVENQDDDETDDEDVEIIQATTQKLAAATMVAEASDNTSGDEDVIVEGVLNETRLPHMRQHCTRFPFTAISHNGSRNQCLRVSEANSQACDLCYCYVCDCPVKDCQHWNSSTSTKPERNHCCASDKDGSWESMRSIAKRRKDQATTAGSDDGENERADDDPPSGWHFVKDCSSWGYCDSCWCYICDTAAYSCREEYHHENACPTVESCREERLRRKLSTFGRPGPFKPDNPDANLDKDLTKCRHCSWYIRLEPCRNTPSSRDWCTHCGLVASENDLEKAQETATDDKPDQIQGSSFLGQKEIPFRIQAHDPRLFEKYKENWVDDGYGSSEWQYNDADREEEVFLHRIGKSPTFSNIVKSIPYVEKENIPKTFETPSNSLRSNDWQIQDATDAVIIEDPKQLQFVYQLASIGKEMKSILDVNASWDKESRSGVFKIRLKLPEKHFVGHFTRSSRSDIHLPLLLGVWFGLFPIQPSDLCGIFHASSSEDIINDFKARRSWNQTFHIPMKPYKVELSDVMDDLHEKLPSRVGSLLSAKNVNENRLTMEPSNGSRFSGGVCSPASPTSFRDAIMRYVSEHFLSYTQKGGYDRQEDLIASCLGATRRNSFETLDVILGFQTAVTAQNCFERDALECPYHSHESQSIEQTMIALENLGHESEDCVEGLKIDLLDFQRQSLKWALEREQTPGGVQSYFWPKLPQAGEGQEDIFFNPILKCFRKDKPAVVRGGFIAEQMGLGKTVISLALILKNPAPNFPKSGSPISELMKKDPCNAASKSCGWEKNLYEKTSISNKKTGSIICKGTLVICPVSLVGQWIDEARSKLREPGLIYPYHGGNRKRDPKILAGNSIVVTTYDVLSSDAFHHAKKAGAEYCPPLQQIRWWRIICDEGHILRESNTRRSKAVLSLVADHKWIVSGTPMNTSYYDLKNQLKFLGFEHVEKVFDSLCRGKKEADFDLLMYFLRPIMMRHSQEQKYRGTSTTLMSLPQKTERKEMIQFTAKEKKEFQKIEKEAQDWYINFRSANRQKISKHFLKISSKLTPLRIACSGGKYPINSGKNVDEDVDGVIEDENDEKKKVAKNQMTGSPVYSKFVFKSKFNALLKQLKKIRDDEPDSKSLVFSQFSSTLDWLKVELPKHGFQFRTLSGNMSMKSRAKALSEFQNDPPTTIFLLSMRAGAVGINLTQANRVFLMEPSFNPALEAQAIGRIHRLGQKRPVEIVRMVVKNSLEERMVNFLEKKYGKSPGKKAEAVSGNDEKNNESDKKSVDGEDSKNYCNTIAGNLNTDKVQLVTDEFDTLFGVMDRLQREDKKIS